MEQPTSILIIEDDHGFAEPLCDSLRRQKNWLVVLADTAADGFHRLETERYDVVVLDWYLGPGKANADEFLRRKAASFPETWVIVYSGARVEADARANGADAFVSKGIDSVPKLVAAIEAGVRAAPVKASRALARRLTPSAIDSIIGASRSIQELRGLIERVAPSDISVLIRGESGTGKELVARALHELGPRRKGEFVPVLCPSIPESMLESEMFGHTQGAFTGAVKARKGLLEYGSGGTVFLDEIGDMPSGLQAKLLRVLEDHQVRRVGSDQSIKLDLRMVAATNRDLEAMLETGGFRRDLYTRLNGVTFWLTPLRERREDIPALLDAFVKDFAQRLGRPVPRISQSASDALFGYPFPGNVRELRSMAERAVLLNGDGVLQAADFGLNVSGGGAVAGLDPFDGTLGEARDRFERRYLSEWLERCDGNVVATAKAIGISRNQLHRLLKKHALRNQPD